MEDRVSKETKIHVAKDLVANYVRGEGGKNVNPDDLGSLFKKVYQSLEETFPEPEKRKVGLGA